LAKEAVPRARKRGSTALKWPDWQTALSGVTNNAVSSYFNQELKANRESYLRKRSLLYRVSGKRRWFLAARNKNAYVWQYGRFAGDVEYWQNGLSRPDDVKPVKREKYLRMFLNTDDDFQYFHNATSKTLESTDWLGSTQETDPEDLE